MRTSAPALVLPLVLLAGGVGRAQSPQEKKRSDILNDLGLKKKPPAPPAAPAPAEGTEETPGAPAGGDAKTPKGTPKSAGPAAPSFGRAIHPALVATCKPCHAPGAPGGLSRFLLSGD